MSSTVLSDKDVNLAVSKDAPANGTGTKKPDMKSLEYHRQVLQSKMAEEKDKQTYISPSDNIMSPCTAKLNAFRNKQVGKAKPRSLFAQASHKKFAEGENVLGARNMLTTSSSPEKKSSF